MNKTPLDIIIENLVPRLPAFKQVGMDPCLFTGHELLLAGVREFEGQPIDPYSTYNMPMPRIKYHRHERMIRREWRYRGMQGVYEYLAPFLTPESLDKLKKRIMHVA